MKFNYLKIYINVFSIESFKSDVIVQKTNSLALSAIPKLHTEYIH